MNLDRPALLGLFLVVVITTALAICASADTMFEATIDGLSNVPPLPAASGTGSATLSLNNAQTELSYHIVYQGLSSRETDAHIHNGGKRENGPIVFQLPLGSPKDGTLQMTPTLVDELIAERLYINIHTEMYPGGELRGNIVHSSAPTEPTTWGQVKALYRGEF